MKTRNPFGKGIYVWSLAHCAGGDPLQLALRAERAGFDWLAVKVADGVAIYQPDRLGAAIEALNARGIEVWGWFYTYGRDWFRRNQAKAEATAVVQAASEYRLAGLIVDAEKEYKESGAAVWAHTLMTTLRGYLPDLPVGLSSYRYPSYHPEFCWHAFLPYVDFHAPQVYWEQSHNPAYQLKKSAAELKGLKDLAVIPAGSAYELGVAGKKGHWRPTAMDMAEFHDAVRELELPGVFYWSWQHAERMKDIWEEIVKFRPGDGSPGEQIPEETLEKNNLRPSASISVPSTSAPDVEAPTGGETERIVLCKVEGKWRVMD